MKRMRKNKSKPKLTPFRLYQQLSSNIAAMHAAPPNYSAISLPGGVQCSMWAVEMLHGVDLIPSIISPSTTPELIPILDALIWNPVVQSIGFWLYNLPSQIDTAIRSSQGSYRIVYYDPLVLDLDGDGIETVASNGLAGALFDQNGDGIRTATGWVKSDDGILVRDLNGNGAIDDGTEVFGDSTALASGGRAANGFAALADLDSNHDGKIDSLDANFAGLQIWRDLNRNGVSDAGELFTLQQVGVQSLNVTPGSTAPTAVAGGTQAETGNYTRTDGSVRTMADVNLTQDTFHTRYIDQITVPAELQGLPNVGGVGRLRDLRQAANDEMWRAMA